MSIPSSLLWTQSGLVLGTWQTRVCVGVCVFECARTCVCRSGRCFFCLRDSSTYSDNSPEWTVALNTTSQPINPVACSMLLSHIVGDPSAEKQDG